MSNTDPKRIIEIEAEVLQHAQRALAEAALALRNAGWDYRHEATYAEDMALTLAEALSNKEH